MDRKVIYRKTAKGQEEMATRAHHLPSRERSILVLVDGKRTGEELIDKSRHFGDGEGYLDRLIATGFVEAITETPNVIPAPSIPPDLSLTTRTQPSRAATGAARSTQTTQSISANTLTDTINFARHFLLRALGPDADELAARIESSRNLKDLTQTLTKGRDALAALVGRRKAEEFWQGIRDRLPQIPPFSTQ